MRTFEPDFEKDLMRRDVCSAFLSCLQGRSLRIMEMRFGLHGQEPHTLKQVADKLGVTGPAIRATEQKALEVLRNKAAMVLLPLPRH